MEELWDRREVDPSEMMKTLPDGVSGSWYRYTIREDGDGAQTAIDEVIVRDKTRLVIFDFGGGTDENGVEEAIAKFL